MTLSDAKALRYGTILYHVGFTNADGTPARYKVNGAVKTWKTRPDEVRVPLKRGLYEYGYLTEASLNSFSLIE